MKNCNNITTKKPFRIWIKSQEGKRCLLGLVFLVPFISFLALFSYYVIFQCIFQSFFQYRLTDLPGDFVGLENYKSVLRSKLFATYFKNSLSLYAYSMMLGFFVPLLQALALFQLTKTRSFFRYLYILPCGIVGLAGLAVWKYIWDPTGGLANFITSNLGLGTFGWLTDPNLVKFCLRFPGFFGGGMNVILYLVTMNNIPVELFEAAKIDGASAWKLLRYITLPGVKGMIFIQILFSLTGSLLAFEDVYMMTQGGPGFSSTTLVMGAYIKGFREQNFGVSMAMSTLILIITLVITAFVYSRMYRKEE